jgi:hypothetical protein
MQYGGGGVGGSPLQGGGALSFPPLAPFSPSSGSAGVPLSPEQGGGAWGSSGTRHDGATWSMPGVSRGGSLLPSESRHPRAASSPPGLAVHKRALREKVRVKASTRGVFPFCSRAELGLRGELQALVNPNLFMS